jgi:hypothetical protein
VKLRAPGHNVAGWIVGNYDRARFFHHSCTKAAPAILTENSCCEFSQVRVLTVRTAAWRISRRPGRIHSARLQGQTQGIWQPIVVLAIPRSCLDRLERVAGIFRWPAKSRPRNRPSRGASCHACESPWPLSKLCDRRRGARQTAFPAPAAPSKRSICRYSRQSARVASRRAPNNTQLYPASALHEGLASIRGNLLMPATQIFGGNGHETE